MRLRELRLRNFRCYKEEISIPFEEMTTIVGRNDAGKSTILEALDIFFNESVPDKNDGSKSGDLADIGIVCIMDDLPDTIILDDNVPTTLQGELLLNNDGFLELHKVFNGSLATPKLSSFFAKAMHPPGQQIRDLLKLNNKGLKDLAKTLNVDLASVNKTVNSELRAAIRSSVGVGQLIETNISFMKDDAEKVGKGLQAALPAFALFKSDRASTDQDPEAQEPLKAAIREAVKLKELELNAIAEHINAEVKKIADLTLEKLREMDDTLASTLTPQFTPPNWASLFKASITGDDEIPINKRGSGVRRLILLNFFRAKSEKQASENKKSSTIYAIEEPETSQHPHNQRLLISALQEISTQDQVIITTHTPMLARVLPAQSLRFIRTNELSKTKEVLLGGTEETNKIIADSLGVLPDHNVRVFIGVEGKTDIPFMKNMAKILKDSGEDVVDLEQAELNGHLIFAPLGGSGLAEWTNRLSGLNRPEFHIYDRDTEPPAQSKYQKYIDEINLRSGCKATATNKREVENYVHHNAINAALADRGKGEIFSCPIGNTTDVAKEFVAQLNVVAPPNDKWGSTKAKEFICSASARKMTRQMLDEVDTSGEVLGWMKDIKMMFDRPL